MLKGAEIRKRLKNTALGEWKGKFEIVSHELFLFKKNTVLRLFEVKCLYFLACSIAFPTI